MFPTFTSLLPVLTLLLTLRPTHAVHVHQRDTQPRGFHYHYEVISPSALSSSAVVSPLSSGSEPSIEPLRTDESRATFGYRKPSGEYRVVDYLADGLGFNRKGMLSDSERSPREQRQTATSTSTSTTTTTVRPSPIYVPSTSTTTPDYDDEEEDREPLPIPPPAPLRMGKTSPAQQARLMRQQDQTASNGKVEEQKIERLEMRSGSVKGGSKKSKENEIRQEKMDKPEPTTVRSPLPPTTTTTATTTTTTSTPVMERESEPLMIRPSTGRIKGRLSEVTPDSMTTTMEPELVRLEPPQKLVQTDGDQPQNKISIHQLISQAMPTLQMSVVPVYFMNRATRTVMAVPYLVMKSVSKMPLIPGMVDALSGPSLSGAQNLLSFANQKTERNIAMQPIANMLALRTSSMDQPVSAAPVVRGSDASQTLESGVEESHDEESSSTGIRSPSSSVPAAQSESNWVTIDSPVTSESLDNTWFKR